MIHAILLSVLFYSSDTLTNYPLHVVGNPSAVQSLVRILDTEFQTLNVVRVQLINPETGEYGISLSKKLESPGWLTRENRFQCTLNYLLGDSSKVVRLRLVENDPRVLISDGRKGVLDITDIEKFNSSQTDNFNAFNVLTHELYEQYQLQVVKKLLPGKIKPSQLKAAHLHAVQKESNLYSLTMVRTEAEVNKEYVHIEFTSRTKELCHHHYYAYYHNGNVTKVERGEEK